MSIDSGLGIIVAGAIGSWGAQQGTKLRRSIGPIIANITEQERHEDEIEITSHPVERGAQISDHMFKKPAEVTIRCAWSNSPNAPASLLGGITGALTNKLTGAIQNQITGAAAKAIGGSALGNLAVANLGKLISNPLISFGAQVNTGKGKGTSTVQDVYQQLLNLQRSGQVFDVYTGKRKYSNMLLRSITTETDKNTENALVCLLVLREVIIVTTTVVAVTAPADAQKSPEKTVPPVDAGVKQVVGVIVDQNLELAKSLAQTFPVRSGEANVRPL